MVAPVFVADAEVKVKVKVLGASERAELVQASGMSGAQYGWCIERRRVLSGYGGCQKISSMMKAGFGASCTRAGCCSLAP